MSKPFFFICGPNECLSYGEQGSIIIHQTLYSLFPSDDIPLTSVDPLTPDQFLTRVLVPETAVLLIQVDMCLPTKEEALRVLDESKKYGVAMFPEQAQGEEAAEVGEQLARERAKERRKLLEERGEADADVHKQVEQERKLAKKAKGKDKDLSVAKGKGKGKGSENGADPLGDEEERPGKGIRKVEQASDSSESIVKAGSMRLKASGGVSILDGPSQLIPCPLKEQIRESSILSWRSKRSPSTSPDPRPPKPTLRSSSLYKINRKPSSSLPRPPTQEKHQESQWIFNLRNFSPSPDHEHVDFDEIPVKHEANTKAGEPADSDSDVVVINVDSTLMPRFKPKSRRVQKSIINNLSDSEATTRKTTPKPKTRHNQKAERREDQTVGVALGQTRRKKNGTAKDNIATSDGSTHTWLLDDISE